MLDNEPIAGPAGDTTEKQPPRRRAASRPAGPPPEEAERAAGLFDDSTPAVPLTRPAGTATVVIPARETTTTPEMPKTPEPSRDTPETAETSSRVSEVPEAPTGTGAEAATDTGGTEEAVVDAAPKRTTRRRSTSTTTRRRTTKKTEETDVADAATTATEATGTEAGEAPAKPRRGGRRKAAAEERPTETLFEIAASGDATAVNDEPSAVPDLPEDEPLDDEPPGEDIDEEPSADADLGTDAAEGDIDDVGNDIDERDDDDDDIVPVGDIDDLDAIDDEDDEDVDDLDEEPLEPSNPLRVLADPFGLTARDRVRTVPPPVFPTPATVLTPLFQAPDPLMAEQVRQQAVRAAREAVQRDHDSPEDTGDPADTLDAAEPVDDELDLEAESEETGTRRRRRRRGGRGRGRSRDREAVEEVADERAEDVAEAEVEEEPAEQAEPTPTPEEGTTTTTGTRRRRRRRRRGGEETIEPAADDPPNTVVRIRAPRAGRASTSVDEVQSVRGSTRLEAKKQRRREGRELGRRRPPIITESEFLARRESVERVMVVRKQGGRTQIAVLEDGILVEHYVDREAGQSYVGNVYLGKVQNVLPSMEAAFVDIGKGRNAVLYAGEVNFDTAGLEGQPKRIESALKSGQSVLVQVTKDPIGHKGARLTSQISLPGRYLVYIPDGSMTGISRKLPDKERTRLKGILKKVMPENAGVIVRTAAEGASEEELARDVARLSAQWENIQRKAKSASPPELLYSEPDLTIRVVRDVFNEDFSSLVVAGDEMWETVDEYVRYVAPHLADRLTRWDEEGDVFAAYRIDEQIAKALERKVWLPSGGSLVIDRTEAMTVIDVNTGKFTGQGGNLEETVTRNNLEAAEEIVRQLRLRDIGGIIVIDFIDMVLESNRELVLRRLLECLARDRTKHQVAEVTSLGLVQMTRKRVGQGLLEAFSTPCECCNGRGLHISTEPVSGKPEPRGTQAKMAIEKAVAEKLSKNGDSTAVAAEDTAGRDSVTDTLDAVSADSDQGRGRRRSRRAKPAE